MIDPPGPNMPLRLWLERHLGDVKSRLDAGDLRRSISRPAQLAYEGGGFDLLIDFLCGYGALDADRRQLVGEGVVELILNFDRPPRQRRSGAGERLAKLELAAARCDGAHEANGVPTMSTEVAVLGDAVEAAHHFFLLSRAAVERARFGGSERAADLALFETFRFARIAAEVSGAVGPNESQLLATILSWSPAAGRLGDQALSTAMLAGVSEVEQATQSLTVRSMVLKIVSSHVDTTRRLSDCALELMSTVMRLGGLVGDEVDAFESLMPETVNDELEAELATVRKAMFVIPRGRSTLRPEPEFDALWRIYRAAVPWSSPDRRPV